MKESVQNILHVTFGFTPPVEWQIGQGTRYVDAVSGAVALLHSNGNDGVFIAGSGEKEGALTVTTKTPTKGGEFYLSMLDSHGQLVEGQVHVDLYLAVPQK